MSAKRLAWPWLVAVLLLSGGVACGRAPAPGPEPALDKATAAEVEKLLKERRDALRQAVDAREKQFLAGRGTLDILLDLSQKLLQAELDLATTPAQRIAAHQAYYERARSVEEANATLFAAGRVTVADYQQSRAARAEAEIGLLRAGGKPKKVEKKEEK